MLSDNCKLKKFNGVLKKVNQQKYSNTTNIVFINFLFIKHTKDDAHKKRKNKKFFLDKP